MKIIIDEREQLLYEKCKEITRNHFSQTNYLTIEKTPLHIGDVYITTDEERHVCVIERKTLQDLLASFKDGRYEEQSHRLIHSTKIHTHNIIYIIEGMMSQCRTFMEKKLIYSAITSLNHFKGMTVLRTSGIQETSELIVWYSDKIERNFLKHICPKYLSNIYGHPNKDFDGNELIVESETLKETTNDDVPEESITQIQQQPPQPLPPTTENENNFMSFEEKTTTPSKDNIFVVKKSKKENITPDNIGSIILSQIPFVNSVTANTIMKQYEYSLKNLIKDLETNRDCLNQICIESIVNGKTKKRKIASNAINNIYVYLVEGGKLSTPTNDGGNLG